MAREVIHVEADLVVSVGYPELLQVLLELRRVYALFEDLKMFSPFFLGNSGQ